MKFMHKFIRWIEGNSRDNERRNLIEELQDLCIGNQIDTPRARQIIERLNVLDKANLQSYLDRDKPVKSVSQMVQEDDCGVPEGLVGEWKAPI